MSLSQKIKENCRKNLSDDLCTYCCYNKTGFDSCNCKLADYVKTLPLNWNYIECKYINSIIKDISKKVNSFEIRDICKDNKDCDTCPFHKKEDIFLCGIRFNFTDEYESLLVPKYWSDNVCNFYINIGKYFEV